MKSEDKAVRKEGQSCPGKKAKNTRKDRAVLGKRQKTVSSVGRKDISRVHQFAKVKWENMKKANPTVRLKKNRNKFIPYGTQYKLPVLGRAKVKRLNMKGNGIKSMMYAMEGTTESLLKREGGARLGTGLQVACIRGLVQDPGAKSY